MKAILLACALLLLVRPAIAEESIVGVWSNPGGSFTFFGDGQVHIAWLRSGQYVTGTWRLSGAVLDISTDGGESMQFRVLRDGENLELTDEQGVYRFQIVP